MRKIKIVVRPFEDDLEEVVEAFKKVERREFEGEEEKIVVDSLDTLRRVLTPERLRILHVIKTRKPESIYELAKILNRDRSSVVKDLEYLKLLGLVEFEELEVKGKKKPIVTYDEIIIAVPLTA